MAERITLDMVVADLAATIRQWNETNEAATSDYFEALAALLGRMRCERLEHALLRAVLAIQDIEDITDRCLDEPDRIAIGNAGEAIRQALARAAGSVPPSPGSPWLTIMRHYVGDVPQAPPDPLVELGLRNRRLGEELEAADEKGDPARFRHIEAELSDTTDRLLNTPATTLAGAAAQVRRVLFEMGDDWDRDGDDWQVALRSVLAVMETRQ